MPDLIKKIIARECVVMDGATGTNLFDKGLVSGDAPELWNVDHPDRVFELNASFVEAGSDVVLTNTFGGNAMRLKLHASENRVDELNETAAKIARDAVSRADREVLVAGSIGPLGELLFPLGEVTHGDAVEAFAAQALALERGGCDILWIETMSATEELLAAAEGASRTDLPFAMNASFDTNGRTMMGITPSGFVELCLSLEKRPVAVGSNCGIGPAQTVAAVLEMAESSSEPIALIAKANCGVPQWEGAKIVYSATPEQMFIYAQVARDAGASVIGGCCGTKPEHVTRIREALTDYEPGSRPSVQEIENRLGEVFQSSASKQPKARRSRRRSR